MFTINKVDEVRHETTTKTPAPPLPNYLDSSHEYAPQGPGTARALCHDVGLKSQMMTASPPSATMLGKMMVLIWHRSQEMPSLPDGPTRGPIDVVPRPEADLLQMLDQNKQSN